MKPLALIIVLAVVLSGCNNLNDLRPVDPGTEIPEAAVKVVKSKFPKAEELVFKPILADKIWEVKLKSDADRYSSLVDYGKMWETFKIMPDGVPATLETPLQKTIFGSGTLSAYTTAYYAASGNNKLVYNYKGENYAFLWSGATPTSNSSAAFDQNLYRIATYEIADLPAFVKDTIINTKDMAFTVGYTWVRMDDTKRYQIFTRQKIGNNYETVSMLFDEKGKLRWNSIYFSPSGMISNHSNLETLPEPIKQYLDSQPELSGYEFETRLMNNVNGLTSYYIAVRVGSDSRCQIYFDKDFNMLTKSYTVILYP